MDYDKLLEMTSQDEATINYEYEEGGQYNNPSVEQLTEEFFKAAMKEMERYIRLSDNGTVQMIEEGNISNVYINNKPFEASTVIVEFDEVPEDFRMENAELREFSWYPEPALSNQFTAAYFQFRQG